MLTWISDVPAELLQASMWAGGWASDGVVPAGSFLARTLAAPLACQLETLVVLLSSFCRYGDQLYFWSWKDHSLIQKARGPCRPGMLPVLCEGPPAVLGPSVPAPRWHTLGSSMVCLPQLSCGIQTQPLLLPCALFPPLQINLGPEGLIPLEVRFLHNPWKAHGFVGAALSSNVIHLKKVITL